MPTQEVRCVNAECGALNRVPGYSTDKQPRCSKCRQALPESNRIKAIRGVEAWFRGVDAWLGRMSRSLHKLVCILILQGGLLLCLAGGLILGWQCLYWLRFGTWPIVDGWMAWLLCFAAPTMAWLGAQKALYWALDQPLSAILFLAGSLVALAASSYMEDRRL